MGERFLDLHYAGLAAVFSGRGTRSFGILTIEEDIKGEIVRL